MKTYIKIKSECTLTKASADVKIINILNDIEVDVIEYRSGNLMGEVHYEAYHVLEATYMQLTSGRYSNSDIVIDTSDGGFFAKVLFKLLKDENLNIKTGE